MTNTDELSRLARAITEAEDALNTSNHRDDCQQLATMDAERNALIERIDAREKALEVAREAMTAYAEKLASAGAVKVDIAAPYPTREQVEIASRQSAFQTASPYSNGLDGHQED